MASFSKRVYQTWRVIAKGHPDLKKTFGEQSTAQAYAVELKETGIDSVQVKPVQSTGRQARIPVALLADRVSCVKSIVVMDSVWSLATISCMFTANYSQLFAARAMVGLVKPATAP